MTRLTTTEVRRDFAEAVNRVAFGKERVVIFRRGQDLAAVVPLEDLRLLERLEDAVDIEEARAALSNRDNKKALSWSELKTTLQ